ncbi:MAG: tetratricopeptide repeat protein, partial [Candidatus Poribacteria bacterium]|nr:tetratricopeptide repeat protein [Candidatus Poribacteria bacterium]
MNISKNKKLVPKIAEQLIIELFAGQTKELNEIKTKVEEVHKQRGGLPFTSKYHPVQIALTKLKKTGVVENPQLRYWSIPIRKLEDFINWAKQFQEGNFVFRGVPNAAFKIQASASLRPHVIEQMYIEKQHDEEKRNYNKYLYINKELITKSKQRGYNKKDGKEFNILDILAELQHYGAATCLIDFTCSAQIALWFACQPYQKSKDEHQEKKDKKKETEDSIKHVNGKVYAVKHVPPRSSGLPKCIEITPEFLEKDAEKKKNISYFLKEEKDAPLYYYQPKYQNHRIIAQQSVFLFGQYKFKADNECVIAADCKEKILNELHKSSGLTEDKLFPDFEGFATWVHSKDSPYTEPTPSALKARSRTVFDKSHATEIEFEEVIGDLSRAINKDDNDVEAYNLRGRAYTSLERYDRALEDFEDAERIDPDDAETYFNRGYLYQQQGLYSDAINDYDTAISKNKDYGEAYYRRGRSNYDLGHVEEALTDFERALPLQPNSPYVHYWLGLTKQRLGQEEELKDFDEAIRLKPDYFDAYFQRGLVLKELQEYPSALNDFDRAIELNPNDISVYYNRSETLFLLQLIDDARQDLEFALELAKQQKNDEMVAEISSLIQDIFGHNTSE